MNKTPKLVKTELEIIEQHIVKYGEIIPTTLIKELSNKELLILPRGLDKLEEMLKQELSDFLGMTISKEASSKFVSSVFSRFKKEVLE